MDNGASSYRRFRECGDESGLEEIIREYRDGLIFYLLGFVDNIHTAEELAKDTFVLLGTKKPRNKGGSSFKTWLYTIGRNIALNYLRRRRRQKEISMEEIAALAVDEAELEGAYFKEERKLMLHRAMKRLKKEHRIILWLIYFEEMSLKDAAAVMKKSVHACESLAYRARKALAEQLEKEGFIYEEL